MRKIKLDVNLLAYFDERCRKTSSQTIFYSPEIYRINMQASVKKKYSYTLFDKRLHPQDSQKIENVMS